MRQIASFSDEVRARALSSFLTVHDVENDVDQLDDGSWSVWIVSEDDIERAAELISLFRKNPDRPEYIRAVREDRRLKKAKKSRRSRSRLRYVDVRTTWGSSARFERQVLTLTLIAISIIVAIVTRLGTSNEILMYLTITRYEIAGNFIRWIDNFPEIRSGEVWRLVTPIFIHLGIIHLLFNMLWLKTLGEIFEAQHSTLRLGLFVVVTAVLSNVAQYFTSGPSFGGMSGVVYGLLGFIWLRGRFDPTAGYRLNQGIVVMMIIWFFLGFTGLIGHIANTAHGVGFGVGLAWGYFSSGHLWRHR